MDENPENNKRELGDVLFDLKRKIDNAWYHYKLAIIAGLGIAALLIFALVQCAARVEGDADVAYIGGVLYNYVDLEKDFADVLNEDLNGDQKTAVDFVQYRYMTDVQVEDARAAGQTINIQEITIARTQINLELNDGNIIIYFMDPEAYREYKKINGVNTFMTLEDALGYTPEKRYDEFAVSLKDLYCWDYYAGIGSLPEDTLVAVREYQNADKTTKGMDEKYRRNLIMFGRLVNHFQKFEESGD